MMGQEKGKQGKLFYYNFSLEERIRSDHPLRKIADLVDFDFAYDAVRDKYGHNGNVSVPPPVILKLMLLLVFYNVRSERELMDTLPERLDWLWFLGFDLDSTIPNHSVLSKARKRWGAELFKSFFERIVWQCFEAGLVDGKKIFLDSSLVDADASNNSVVDTKNLKHQLRKNYRHLEARLAESEDSSRGGGRYSKVNKRFISSTDPDAAIVRRGKAKLRYQVHRAVDEKNEVITATGVTAGDVSEAHELVNLMEQHEATTGVLPGLVVADSKYGTVENYLTCFDRGVDAHIPDLKATGKNKGRRKDIFPEEAFRYDPETDTYTCPAGQTLTQRRHKKKRKAYEYGSPRKVCNACQLYDQCTSSKTGRTVKRHHRHEDLELMRSKAGSIQAKRDIRIRQHLMERSFARSCRYGFKRSRWRRSWRNQIQEYLTAAIQNIMVLVNRIGKPSEAMVQAKMKMRQHVRRNLGSVHLPIRLLLGLLMISLQEPILD